MANIIIIGGIESTFINAQVLYEMGENILMFYTRGPNSPGWEGVDHINPNEYSFTKNINLKYVEGHINELIEEIRELNPDFIYSLGWQQIFNDELLALCPIIGLHESLLPTGAGPVPIANAILHDEHETGVTLFWVDKGMDTGPIIGQLKSPLNPQITTSSELYEEVIELEKSLLKMMVPHINKGTAPSIKQDFSQRTTYSKIDWNAFESEKVNRARVYPYA